MVLNFKRGCLNKILSFNASVKLCLMSENLSAYFEQLTIFIFIFKSILKERKFAYKL